MERLYRIIFLALFILGFVGAAASARHTSEDEDQVSPIASLIRDVRMAQEVNDLNQGRWNDDVAKVNEQSLTRVENLFANDTLTRHTRR